MNDDRLDAEALEAVLARADQPRLVYQPVVDLRRGVVAGYEALSRFDGSVVATPDRWFAAAEALGRGTELELRVVEQALAARERLPPNTFVTLNVSPKALVSPAMAAQLDRAGPLDRAVFEITEQEQVHDYGEIAPMIASIRERGGMIAVDDAGAGYASLRHVMQLRPQFVKLDRELVRDLDRSPLRRAVVEMLGELASRIDAWIVAEGVERPEETEVLGELGVPLAQGYFLARPAPPWAPLEATASAALQGAAQRWSDTETVARLVERRPCLPDDSSAAAVRWFASHAGLDTVVGCDEMARPCRLWVRVGMLPAPRRPLLVAETTPLHEAARRAVARERAERFDDLVCTDEMGRYTGIVEVGRLVERLARR